jgi:hypothetical protein
MSRVEELVENMRSHGVSGTTLIFAQTAMACMNMSSETSGIRLLTPKTGTDAKPNSVTLNYTTTAGSIDLTPIMRLVCGGNNGITHAAVLMNPEAKGVIFMNVTIENTLTPRVHPRAKFNNRVTDSLKTLALGAVNTAVGVDVQRYMINISQNQCIPTWRIDPGEKEITLFADNIVELDLFHIRPLLNRWTQISKVVYTARPASKGAQVNATYPFMPTMSFTYARVADPPAGGGDDEIEVGEVVQAPSKSKRVRGDDYHEEEEERPAPPPPTKWFFGIL